MLALLTTLAINPAQAGSVSDTETSYVGAIMLEGRVDVDFGSISVGDMNKDSNVQTEYAYWSGNTLYVGAEDENGNGVDGIMEFFWFESSIDRGSDFYVAIIKARTTPNVNEDWYLNVGDDPVLQVSAKTDIGRENGAFRWDWSIPFENYGMDSYGQVTMRSAYGVGANAEGAVMYAQKVEEDGASAEVNVQTKGYVAADYSVRTEYSITLWSWYTRVRGEPGEMTWNVTLDNDWKDDESAYHEYFLVMQVDEGQPFTIDEFQIGATCDDWWWFSWNQFSVRIEDVTLTRPYIPEEEPEEEEEEEEEEWEDTGWDWFDTGSDPDDLENPDVSGGVPLLDDENSTRGCSAMGPIPTKRGFGLGLALGLAGLTMVTRRR